MYTLSALRNILTCCVIGFGSLLHAQAPDSLRLQRSVPALASFATSDHFSNTYLITPENALIKYDSSGRQVASYTNNRLGQAAFIDAANPLKILAWYPDFQTVVLLDRTLTEMGRLNFSPAGLYSVRCVAMALDGNIWVFDDAVSKAVKLGIDGAVLLESPPLNVYFPKRFSPTRIRDSGRFICLNDPATGMCLLDQYANLEKVLNTQTMATFEADGEWLYFLEKDFLVVQNLAHIRQLKIRLPEGLFQTTDAYWLGQHDLFVQKSGRLLRYTWE